MRNKEEILNDFKLTVVFSGDMELSKLDDIASNQKLILEVLLDIRDMKNTVVVPWK